MMSFLKFIEEDIQAKKTLISTMPTRTKRDIKKYNEKITSTQAKYQEYKKAVSKYIDTKSKSFKVKIKDEPKDLSEINSEINKLEHIRFTLNPGNTFLEKMGFDNLLFQISYYYDFNFHSLNDIIDEFLNKFESVKVKLTSDDFDYTCYVNEYMKVILNVRNSKDKNYDSISEIFEKIYWANPEIIEHIELNFRKLIKKYEKKFENYISDLQKQLMNESKITGYQDCIKKLKAAYTKLNDYQKENVSSIINDVLEGKIEINNYFENNKFRITTYNTLMIEPIDSADKVNMDKFYENLEKLKINLEEYSNYLKFIPLITAFKKEYEHILIKNNDQKRNSKDKNDDKNKLKNIAKQIDNKEAKLNKINRKIFTGKLNFFERTNRDAIKTLKMESVRQAKILHGLYKIYDQEYFKEKVLKFLNKSLTISELLNLYYSYDFFKKAAIKSVFEISDYNEIIKYSDSFDLFAMNQTNVIVNNLSLFEESNIERVIMNKYRLVNINILEENIKEEELNSLLEKIQLVLRVKIIEESPLTIEMIWFIAEVNKFLLLEKNKSKS